MNNINSLKPEKVFRFFNEISQIPHGSGNTAQIAEYCLEFAAERNLKAVMDEGDNVIIYADGTQGYENSEPVIIQGHMDMVCEKTPQCTKDMAVDGLSLSTDGEWLWAEGTTLGGDDGIALAYIFALLDSDDIPHPPIEAVITRDEETGMFGAELFNASLVKAKKIINIDMEEEGTLTVSCAGGITAHNTVPLTAPTDKCGFSYEISVDGLLGGHSGVDIDKKRHNAFKLVCELLKKFKENDITFRISDIQGGGKFNVIPKNASVIIGTESECLSQLNEIIALFKADFESKYSADEPNAVFTVKSVTGDYSFYDLDSTDKIINFITEVPNGVHNFSPNIPDLVETSLNMGAVSLDNDKLSAHLLIRGNNSERMHELMKKLEVFSANYNAECVFDSEYPAWEYRENSPLRQLAIDTFTDLYGKAPIVSAIHAGLECGIFSKKIDNADIISFGPDIHDIHTPAERMNIASVERTWNYLKEILRKLK